MNFYNSSRYNFKTLKTDQDGTYVKYGLTTTVKTQEIIDLFCEIDKDVESSYDKLEPLTQIPVRDLLTVTDNTLDSYYELYSKGWDLYQLWIEYVVKYGTYENYTLINKAIFGDRATPDYKNNLIICTLYGDVRLFATALSEFIFSMDLNGMPKHIKYDKLVETIKNTKNHEKFMEILHDSIKITPFWSAEIIDIPGAVDDDTYIKEYGEKNNMDDEDHIICHILETEQDSLKKYISQYI